MRASAASASSPVNASAPSPALSPAASPASSPPASASSGQVLLHTGPSSHTMSATPAVATLTPIEFDGAPVAAGIAQPAPPTKYDHKKHIFRGSLFLIVVAFLAFVAFFAKLNSSPDTSKKATSPQEPEVPAPSPDTSDPDIENPFDGQVVGLQTDHEVIHDGQVRRFHFFVPGETDDQTSYPLVILLHGHGGSSDQMLGLNNQKAPYKIWVDVAAREKIFILVPEGVISPDDHLGWNDCRGDVTTNPSTDDVGFILALADAMTRTYPIDAKRMYASGTSNGGHMSFRLAIEAGDKFAAIAPIVASLPSNSSKCSSPTEAVALLLLKGTDDPILPYHGGLMAGGRGEVLSTVETIEFWKGVNQNTATPVTETFPDLNTADESTIIQTSYGGDTSVQDVILVTMDGAGHTEPSIAEQYSRFFEAIVGIQNHDVEMAELVWHFFQDKSK